MGNIANVTIKDFAEYLKCVRTYTFISLQTRNLSRTNSMLFNERVLRHALFLHYFPQFIVRNHTQPHFLLDIITDFGV